eukprot:CAMPEP_0116545420 /NCGR_PEP_ID=MMETSP0397-20121206/2660_1 /TAXON_ID=216820 /ORGANISM="Cyclophora tenuis, Strain ECT3854" /LENGTH=696 /DNA_ID=CAMNT_0004069735 /DNA_START=59 /DNA_END=2145 /DNA_ORIENTATION=-
MKALAFDLKAFIVKFKGLNRRNRFILNRSIKRLCDRFEKRFMVCHQHLCLDDLQSKERSRVWNKNRALAAEHDLQRLLEEFRSSSALKDDEVALLRDLAMTLADISPDSSTLKQAKEVIASRNGQDTLSRIDNEAFQNAELRIDVVHICLLRVIAQGTFGQVREVRIQGRRRAAKRLLSGTDKSFWRELRLQGKASDDYVARIFGHKELRDPLDGNCYRFFFMEYARCGDFKFLQKAFEDTSGAPRRFRFRALGKSGKACLSLSVMITLFLEISLCLEHLHSFGLIHRDIKPENILLAEGCVPKITDFGTAKEGSTQNNSINPGTPYYQAPEVLYDDRPDRTNLPYGNLCDWYSFGALLHAFVHQWLGRGCPKKAESFPCSDCPLLAKLEEVRSRCLMKYPRERYGQRSLSKELLSATLKELLGSARGDLREVDGNGEERRKLRDLADVMENLQEDRLQGQNLDYADHCTNPSSIHTDEPPEIPSCFASLLSSLDTSHGRELQAILAAIACHESLSSRHQELDSAQSATRIVSVMKANPKDADIQRHGAKILHALISWNADSVSDHDVLIEITLSGLRKHKDYSFLLDATRIIQQLCRDCTTNRTKVRELRGFQILSLNVAKLTLCLNICGAYANLCCNHKANKLSMHGYLDDSATPKNSRHEMDRFPDDKELTVSAYFAICNVTAVPIPRNSLCW